MENYLPQPVGGEDLSQIIQTYEILGLPVDQDLIIQYIQFSLSQKDFANYLELYYKYQNRLSNWKRFYPV